MLDNNRTKRGSKKDAGSVLFMTAVIMVGLLGISAFAIDLVSFYLARAEAQRAADAAALAGAKVFADSSCTGTTAGCSGEEGTATQQAQYVGNQNYIGGQAVSIQSSDVTFSYPAVTEPQITVVVKRSVPTFFAKIFGIQTSNISATATAEAYAGGPTPVGVTCLKPFLMPNCDPNHRSTTGNPNCPDGTIGGVQAYDGYFFAPGTTDLQYPGTYPTGIIGESWTLHSNAAPSQWYLVGFNGAPPSSGSALRDHIAECTPLTLSCGATLTTANGNMVGPVDQGIDALINANGDGLNNGQDSICAPTTSPACSTPPFTITGGNNNPNPDLIGKTFTDYASPSVVTVPVYDGHTLTAGGSTVQIMGYLQVFVQQAQHTGTDDLVYVVILNTIQCGASGSGGAPPPVVAGSSIPIRLIRTS